eukprot:COSAG04_NODE_2755_length_3635_cov_1.914593_5_plen_185_part_00
MTLGAGASATRRGRPTTPRESGKFAGWSRPCRFAARTNELFQKGEAPRTTAVATLSRPQKREQATKSRPTKPRPPNPDDCQEPRDTVLNGGFERRAGDHRDQHCSDRRQHTRLHWAFALGAFHLVANFAGFRDQHTRVTACLVAPKKDSLLCKEVRRRRRGSSSSNSISPLPPLPRAEAPSPQP